MRHRFIQFFLTLVSLGAVHGKCRAGEQCRTKSECNGRFHKGETPRTCSLVFDDDGFCCQDINGSISPSKQSQARPVASKPQILPRPPNISDDDISTKIETERKKTLKEKKKLNLGEEQAGHSAFNKGRESDKDLRDAAFILLHLGEDLLSIRNEGDEDEFVLNADNSKDIEDLCPWKTSRKPKCGPKENIFRTVDGSCNNLFQQVWGMSGTPMQRILPSAYSQKNSQKNLPRVSLSGEQLPSARNVSQTVFFRGVPEDSNDLSTLFMQMGQFIDHDMTHSPAEPEQCCDEILINNEQTNKKEEKPWAYPSDPYRGQPDSCFAIEIPADDEFWGTTGRRCLEMSRSTLSPPLDCRAGVREQMTALTHWLDASNVYGSNEEESNQVRDPIERHLLRVKGISSGAAKGRNLLPTCANPGIGSNFRELEHIEACGGPCGVEKSGCFFTGDLRVNEQPGLTVMHTVWTREHNRVAKLLKEKSNEDDNTIFEKSRRIVIAEWQHIIYNEWLPLLLGAQYMTTFNIFPRTNGYSSDYSRNLDPRINNEFAAAAFRFGHSMIPTTHPAKDSTGKDILPVIDFREAFFKPNLIRDDPSFVDATIRGQSQTACPAWDPVFTDDVTDHLFGQGKGGLDLTATNIQRAREHGVAGYNRYRQVCGLGAASSWEDLKRKSKKDGFLTDSLIERLERVYEHVEDIDLFAAGSLEKDHEDSILGAVFKCIIGDQFQRAKKGDRFWYENIDNGFSLGQLAEVRKVSMARILCDNTDITKMQPLAFKTPNAKDFNQFLSCSDTNSIQELDLSRF